MVRVNEEFLEAEHCATWQLLPLVLLELLLLLTISWRVAHHLRWKSHPRRIFFHVVLLFSCAFRLIFWLSLCHLASLAIGQGLIWWSNSLILLCTASIILQWSSAVDAGRVAMWTVQRVKRCSFHFPLISLHAVHLGCSFGFGVYFMSRWSQHNNIEISHYITKPGVLLPFYRGVHTLTVLVDAAAVSLVARKLKMRLLSAAMSDEMKRKSVIQMLLLVVAITIALTMEIIVTFPVLVSSIEVAWGSLPYSEYCIFKDYIPGEVLSFSFLYIMRRVEQREPMRMVVMPSAVSLVDFEECATPCMWCQHHRRYHRAHNKLDMTYLTAETSEVSPHSGNASFRSLALSANVNYCINSDGPLNVDEFFASLSDHAMEFDRYSRVRSRCPSAPMC